MRQCHSFNVKIFNFNEEIAQKLEIMQTEFNSKFQSTVEINFNLDFPNGDVKFLYDYITSGKGKNLFKHKSLVVDIHKTHDLA